MKKIIKVLSGTIISLGMFNSTCRYLLNAYIDKYLYKHLLSANINVSNE